MGLSSADHGAPASALVILTRPDGRNETLAARLADQGVPSLVLPALSLAPVSGAVAPAPQDFDLLMFVSGYAAQCYFQSWRRCGGTGWPQGVMAAAVGPGTIQALRSAGVPASALLCPDADSRQDSEALWHVLRQRGPIPRRVLIVRGDAGRDWLAEQLRAAGAVVQYFAAYRRSTAVWSASQVHALRQSDPVRSRLIWLASSADGARAIDANVRQFALQAWWNAAPVVTVHDRIAECVRQLRLASGASQSPILVCGPDEQSLFQSMMALAKPS